MTWCYSQAGQTKEADCDVRCSCDRRMAQSLYLMWRCDDISWLATHGIPYLSYTATDACNRWAWIWVIYYPVARHRCGRKETQTVKQWWNGSNTTKHFNDTFWHAWKEVAWNESQARHEAAAARYWLQLMMNLKAEKSSYSIQWFCGR